MQLFSAAAGLDTTKEDYWYKYNKMRLKELVDASKGKLKRDYSAEKIGGTKGRPYKPVRIPKKQLDTKSKNAKMLLKLDLQYFAERDLQRQNSNSIKRSIRKLSKRREEHKTYLVDPYEHAPDWDIKGRTQYRSEPDIKNAGGSTDTLIEVNKMYLAVIKSGKKVTSR